MNTTPDTDNQPQRQDDISGRPSDDSAESQDNFTSESAGTLAVAERAARQQSDQGDAGDDAGGDSGGRQRDEQGRFKAADSADDGGDDESGSDDDAEKDSTRGDLPEGVRKRLARANRQRDEALAAAEEAKREAERLRKERESATRGDNDDEGDELYPDDFDSYAEFERAVERRLEKRKSKKADSGGDDGNDAGSLTDEDRRFIDATGADFSKAQGDLLEALDTHSDDLRDRAMNAKDFRLSASLVVSLSEAERPAEIMEALLEDPERARDLSGMSPYKQARELAKMESELGTKKGGGKRTTSAPPPPETVSTSGRPGPRDPAKMSFSEYEEHMNKQEQGTRTDGWL